MRPLQHSLAHARIRLAECALQLPRMWARKAADVTTQEVVWPLRAQRASACARIAYSSWLTRPFYSMALQHASVLPGAADVLYLLSVSKI